MPAAAKLSEGERALRLAGVTLAGLAVVYILAWRLGKPTRTIFITTLVVFASAFVFATLTDRAKITVNETPSDLQSPPWYIRRPVPTATQEAGRAHLGQSRVVICGLLRDCGPAMQRIRKEVRRVASYFHSYRVLLVENDSSDDTRDQLLRWHEMDANVDVLGCGQRNATSCRLGLSRTAEHSTERTRIDKMTALRNVYMTELKRSAYDSFDYVIVWDLDLVGVLYQDGIFGAGAALAADPNLDGLCANAVRTVFGDMGRWTRYQYHDPYAFKTALSMRWHKRFNDLVNGWMNHSPGAGALRRVLSCFNGFAIYRLGSIRHRRYATWPDKQGRQVCEHVGLNLQLSNLFHAPDLLFRISCNP